MRSRHFAIALVWAVLLVGVGLWAQAADFGTQTTGTIAGTVEDSQGGAIPGATVVLISESSGARRVPAVTNTAGRYLFSNMTPDTYTVVVTMPGFRTLQRPGVTVSGGDRVVVPTLVLEPGASMQITQQPRYISPGDTMGPVILGEDIGFQPVFSPNAPAGTVAGRWMVRGNGEWLETAAPFRVVPAR